MGYAAKVDDHSRVPRQCIANPSSKMTRSRAWRTLPRLITIAMPSCNTVSSIKSKTRTLATGPGRIDLLFYEPERQLDAVSVLRRTAFTRIRGAAGSRKDQTRQKR